MRCSRNIKLHRDETPEDIKKAVPYIKRLIEAYKIPVIDYPGFEADDVIGTLARKASEQGIYNIYDDSGQGFCPAGIRQYFHVETIKKRE